MGWQNGNEGGTTSNQTPGALNPQSSLSCSTLQVTFDGVASLENGSDRCNGHLGLMQNLNRTVIKQAPREIMLLLRCIVPVYLFMNE